MNINLPFATFALKLDVPNKTTAAAIEEGRHIAYDRGRKNDWRTESKRRGNIDLASGIIIQVNYEQL